MKVKYRDIVIEPVVKLINDLVGPRSAKLPFRTARYLGVRVLRALHERSKDFETERVALVKKYGREAEDGKFTVEPQNEKVFNEEYQALLDEEVELANVDKIKDENLQNAELTSAEWLLLDWLVEE